MDEKVTILEGRYELGDRIGKGGTSVVFKAYDLGAENVLRAVKRIDKANREVYDMAKEEAAFIKKLYEADKVNSFVPTIIHRFETDRYFFIVQEFLDGETMEKRLQRGAMTSEEFFDTAKQICRFMMFFHGKGNVHSDMKPENIMMIDVSNDGIQNGGSAIKLKFIDFGTAVGKKTGIKGYTPEYAAPEQYMQAHLDYRTDIFNIGATFYHMLTGKKPLKVDDGKELIPSNQRFSFDKKMNSAIKRIILKCVEYDPDKRYQSCEELYNALCHAEKKPGFRVVMVTFAMSLMCLIGAGVFDAKADKMDTSRIIKDFNLMVGQSKYVEAIKLKKEHPEIEMKAPDGVNIYLEAVNSFTDDNKLDMDENNFIINYLKVDPPVKKGDSDYGLLMYNIANAYLLYFYPYESETEAELEKERITRCAEWFNNAVDSGDLDNDSYRQKYRMAEIYSFICNFYSQSDRMEKEGDDTKEYYKEMWGKIEALSEYIDDGNDVSSVRVCETLLSLLSKNSIKFKVAGIDKKAVDDIFEHIVKKVYDNGAISYTNEYAKEIAGTFNTDSVSERIESAYADGGKKK